MSRKPPAKHQAAFTLPEVMITMLLISMMCLGTFAGMQQVSKAMTAVAIRSEAHRVLQAEAERLLSTEYTSFSPSAEQTVSSSFKPSFIPYNSTGPGAVRALDLTPDNNVGRITFKRQVSAVAVTDTSKTLRVDVTWTWLKQANTVSLTLFRTRS